MILGTDISIEVCIIEGYMLMEYDARKKFNTETDYNIFCYLPHYIIESQSKTGTVKLSSINNGENRVVDAYYSFIDLVYLYKEDKDGIDSFCETHIHVDFNNPTYGDFLNLANDIYSYKGL